MRSGTTVNVPHDSSAFINDNNSCAVVALAAVTGVSFEECQAGLAAHGRKPGHGTHTHQMVSLLKSLPDIQFSHERIWGITMSRSTRYLTVRQLVDGLGPRINSLNMRLLVITRDHALAVTPLGVSDTYHMPRARVERVIAVSSSKSECDSHITAVKDVMSQHREIMRVLSDDSRWTVDEMAERLMCNTSRVRQLVGFLMQDGVEFAPIRNVIQIINQGE